MKYNLIITQIKNPHAKMIVARQLAQNPSISLQKAMAMIEKLPLEYLKNITIKELNLHCTQFDKIGVLYKVLQISELTAEKVEPLKIELPPKAESISVLTNEELNRAPVIPKKIITEQKKHLIFRTFIRQTEPQTKKVFLKRIAGALFGLTIFVLFIIGLAILNSKSRLIKSPDKYLIKANGEIMTRKNSSKNSVSNRKDITAKAKVEAQQFIDSAQSVSNDYMKAITFYKIALSFNKYNIEAWYGLIDTYRSAEMFEQMNDARAQMENLFGKSIFSASEIIQKYGKLLDSYFTEDNVYRLEYLTEKRSEKELVDETYTILRALRLSCHCEAISLFASISHSRGLMVYLKKNDDLTTLEQFKNSVTIQYLQ